MDTSAREAELLLRNSELSQEVGSQLPAAPAQNRMLLHNIAKSVNEWL